jgi:exopolysaccharide biosynthesis protein
VKKQSIIVLLALSLILFIFFLTNITFLRKDDFSSSSSQRLQPSATITEIKKQVINKQDLGKYYASWVVVNDLDRITLESNLVDKLTSTEALARNNCLAVVSGGFFTEKSRHIGLFISNFKIVNDSQWSSFFNGYFSISEIGEPTISSTPSLSSRLALQAGPILIKNSSTQKLSLKNDENARRIAVALDGDRNTVFLVIYSKNSPISGPLLSELPDILQRLEDKAGLKFVDALNLDGGAHSVFVTDEVSLTELSLIGSYFCLK